MNQSALAQRIGVTQSYISQISQGKKRPTISTLEKISECLGVPMHVFFEPDAPPGRSPTELTREEYELIEKYRRLDEQKRKILRNIAGGL